MIDDWLDLLLVVEVIQKGKESLSQFYGMGKESSIYWQERGQILHPSKATFRIFHSAGTHQCLHHGSEY